jgi:hypothetical protein
MAIVEASSRLDENVPKAAMETFPLRAANVSELILITEGLYPHRHKTDPELVITVSQKSVLAIVLSVKSSTAQTC